MTTTLKSGLGAALAAGSIIRLASNTSYTPLQGVPGGTEGTFDHQRMARLSALTGVTGTSGAVTLQQDTVVVLTDVDALVSQGARVIVPAGTIATVVAVAEGSVGIAAGTWWRWARWGLVLAGAGLVGWVGWALVSGHGRRKLFRVG